MKHPTTAMTLRPSQAACLHAIRTGKTSRTRIAVAAGLSPRDVKTALDALRQQGLIEQDPHRRTWTLTKLGRRCAIEGRKNRWGRGHEARMSRMQVGPAGQRLLNVLDRPMRGNELAKRLNVTQERVRQLVLKLLAMGRVRIGDPDRIPLIVARREDPSVLLSYPEERVLSSLPRADETTPSLVATALQMPLSDVVNHLASLCRKNLAHEAGQSERGVHYRLTEAGAAHVQRRSDAKMARMVPLTVKSDRVHRVLSHLAEHGPSRMRDLRDALRIPNDSVNALMQYLKRKGLIQKAAAGLRAPFELTGRGSQTQQALSRRMEEEHSRH
jgi:DNA-binding MarR family transcriptional regulator